jgi:hypothetical protein
VADSGHMMGSGTRRTMGIGFGGVGAAPALLLPPPLTPVPQQPVQVLLPRPPLSLLPAGPQQQPQQQAEPEGPFCSPPL